MKRTKPKRIVKKVKIVDDRITFMEAKIKKNNEFLRRFLTNFRILHEKGNEFNEEECNLSSLIKEGGLTFSENYQKQLLGYSKSKLDKDESRVVKETETDTFLLKFFEKLSSSLDKVFTKRDSLLSDFYGLIDMEIRKILEAEQVLESVMVDYEKTGDFFNTKYKKIQKFREKCEKFNVDGPRVKLFDTKKKQRKRLQEQRELKTLQGKEHEFEAIELIYSYCEEETLNETKYQVNLFNKKFVKILAKIISEITLYFNECETLFMNLEKELKTGKILADELKDPERVTEVAVSNPRGSLFIFKSSKKIVGVDLEIVMKRSPEIEPIPKVVLLLIEYVKTNMESVGMFRKTGRKEVLQKLMKSLDTSEVNEVLKFLTKANFDVVCSALKEYVRKLPESFCPFSLFTEYFNDEFDKNSFIPWVQTQIIRLKTASRTLFYFLFELFYELEKRSSKNKMDVTNLSTVWAINLFKCHPDDRKNPSKFIDLTGKMGEIFNRILTNFKKIFPKPIIDPKYEKVNYYRASKQEIDLLRKKFKLKAKQSLLDIQQKKKKIDVVGKKFKRGVRKEMREPEKKQVVTTETEENRSALFNMFNVNVMNENKNIRQQLEIQRKEKQKVVEFLQEKDKKNLQIIKNLQVKVLELEKQLLEKNNELVEKKTEQDFDEEKGEVEDEDDGEIDEELLFIPKSAEIVTSLTNDSLVACLDTINDFFLISGDRDGYIKCFRTTENGFVKKPMFVYHHSNRKIIGLQLLDLVKDITMTDENNEVKKFIMKKSKMNNFIIVSSSSDKTIKFWQCFNERNLIYTVNNHNITKPIELMCPCKVVGVTYLVFASRNLLFGVDCRFTGNFEFGFDEEHDSKITALFESFDSVFTFSHRECRMCEYKPPQKKCVRIYELDRTKQIYYSFPSTDINIKVMSYLAGGKLIKWNPQSIKESFVIVIRQIKEKDVEKAFILNSLRDEYVLLIDDGIEYSIAIVNGSIGLLNEYKLKEDIIDIQKLDNERYFFFEEKKIRVCNNEKILEGYESESEIITVKPIENNFVFCNAEKEIVFWKYDEEAYMKRNKEKIERKKREAERKKKEAKRKKVETPPKKGKRGKTKGAQFLKKIKQNSEKQKLEFKEVVKEKRVTEDDYYADFDDEEGEVDDVTNNQQENLEEKMMDRIMDRILDEDILDENDKFQIRKSMIHEAEEKEKEGEEEDEKSKKVISMY